MVNSRPNLHLNKEDYLARYYLNSHSRFSKHKPSNNNQLFNYKIDKKDKHLYSEALPLKHRHSNKLKPHRHSNYNKGKIKALTNNNPL